MKSLLPVLVALMGLGSNSLSADLYEVQLNSHHDAVSLKELGAQPVMQIDGGYLFLLDNELSPQLMESGLDFSLLISGISVDQLGLADARDRINDYRAPFLYQAGHLQLRRVLDARRLTSADEVPIHPLRTDHLEFRYFAPRPVQKLTPSQATGLDTLITLISQDSLESYLKRLEAFTHRLAGTDSNYAARDWIASKFRSFGYDSVYLDSFEGRQLWNRVPVPCFNVVAYKRGLVYPDQQIIIGGHFDAVPNCPGADDNASGTAAVLEIARVVRDMDLPMTFIFIAFDSEESWMWGSYHYVDSAVARGDDIVLMVNPDMIAHLTNDHQANLYYGVEDAYARLWDELANRYVDIDGILRGSTASDHLPFQEAGYDVIFVQEREFSFNYHDPTDSSTYLNFEYMTRMVQAILATTYSVGLLPPPIKIVAIDEPGDGASQLVTWRRLNSSEIESYVLYYFNAADTGLNINEVALAASDTSYLVTGLEEGHEYGFFVQAYNYQSETSYTYDISYSTPRSQPVPPGGVVAMPLRDAVHLNWRNKNRELDFERYEIIRDGEVVGVTADTSYVDADPALGSQLHSYHVIAVDNTGAASDTSVIEPIVTRAATLEPNKVLAVNRSYYWNSMMVDAVETGRFMRDALAGFSCDYFSDSLHQLKLYDIVSHGILVIAGESRINDIGKLPAEGGILDTLAYYLSLGGKVVIFGRWGSLSEYHTIDYMQTANPEDDAYTTRFHTLQRVITPTKLLPPRFECDLIGAHAIANEYPDLVWDSAFTAMSSDPFTEVEGIPFVSFANLAPEADILYTYDSRYDTSLSEGRPVAWRFRGENYQYVFFDIPLSFFDRETGAAALQKAVNDLLLVPSDVADTASNNGLPNTFALYQNYPNPFNPTTTITYYLPQGSDVKLTVHNILGQQVKQLVNERQDAGEHHVTWHGANDNGKSVASGVYLYRLEASETTLSRKMLLIR